MHNATINVRCMFEFSVIYLANLSANSNYCIIDLHVSLFVCSTP